MSTPTQQQVMDALATVNDPEIKRPITELGMVDSVEVAEDGSGSVSWKLVRAGVLKALDGAYTLTPDESGTTVDYALAVDVRVPMIGMLKRKAEKLIVDTALKELKKRVESRSE